MSLDTPGPYALSGVYVPPFVEKERYVTPDAAAHRARSVSKDRNCYVFVVDRSGTRRGEAYCGGFWWLDAAGERIVT